MTRLGEERLGEEQLGDAGAPASADARPSALPVEHLFTMALDLSPYTVLADGPHGTRVFCAILGGKVAGPRVRGSVRPGGADWVTMRANGTSRLDVKLLIATDDEALILMEYGGLYDGPGGRGPRSAPTFQASDARYAWLNDVFAVGVGTPGESSVVYEIYALR